MKYSNLFIFLIPILFLISCQKDSNEETPVQEEKKPFVIKLKNKIYSEHVIQMFETRSALNYLEIEDQEWSQNHLHLGKVITPGDSLYLSFQEFNGSYCEYRMGVINPQGLIVNLDDQEGYTYFYPSFSWSYGDTLEMALTIVTDNSGYIYIREY